MEYMANDGCYFNEYGKVLRAYYWRGNNKPIMMDVVHLQKEIVVIYPGAMEKFECRMLFVPPSVNVIAARAFDHAQIGEIDFTGSNLISIECQAFIGCKAKAVLPDSVRYIGDEAVRDLDLVKGGKLKLPSALRYIGKKAFNLGNVDEIQADEAVVTQDSNLDALISMAEDEGKDGLILSVSRDGKEVCRVPFEFLKSSKLKKKGEATSAIKDYIDCEYGVIAQPLDI
jgi:hypothetical protein